MRTTIAAAITVITLAIALVMGSIHSKASYPTTCADFATVLHKQGTVHGSISMHLLGCQDDGNGQWAATALYHATISTNTYTNRCTTLARHYARIGYLHSPWYVAAMVNRTLVYCTVYEDGSYSAGTYPN